MKLYASPNSSATFRVRIALHLKGLAFDIVTLNLANREQHLPEYGRVNPQRRVPALDLGDGTILTQSLAIIDYLDRTYPEPPLFPTEPLLRARVLAAAYAIAMEIQPLNNSGVVSHMRETYDFSEKAIHGWMTHWMRTGLSAVEQLIDGTLFAFGTTPTIADICLVPQVFNAHRFKVDIADLPKVNAVFDVASAHPAFAAAHPSRQPGYA